MNVPGVVKKRKSKWKMKLQVRVHVSHFPFAALRSLAGRDLQRLQLQACGAWLFAALPSTSSPETTDFSLVAPLSSCSLAGIANVIEGMFCAEGGFEKSMRDWHVVCSVRAFIP